MKFTYVYVDLFSIVVPFIFSFHPKLKFIANWKSFLPAIFFTSVFFLIWDILYTNIGVWGFNPKYILGVYFFDLPIEEMLFFVCIPYSCLFTYHCLSLLVKKDFFELYKNLISGILIAILILIFIFYFDRLYSSATSLLLLCLILLLYLYIKPKWLSKFYFSYLILLVPFFIVNGILTGTGINEPVVWYNNSENLGIRILTIPIEDFFYGMLLILMNVTIYEYYKRRSLANIIEQ